MEPKFSSAEAESRWRRRWEELGVGRADVASRRPGFTIALPPPNITAPLHMGHAMGGSVQDILARHRRMLGAEVEWCPGTDHAAIATNAVIERQLIAEGTSREAIGRAAFQARVDAWYEECGGRIYEQMRRLGFTCDWPRSRFTLDDGLRASHPHRLQGPLRRGSDLPRSSNRQLVPSRPQCHQR